jgi:type III secretion protein X
MTDLRISSLVFDRGIESITFVAHDAQPTLPERGDSSPPEISTRPQLSALLERPSIEDYLDGAVRPSIENRDLLTPVRFREALESALQCFRDAAQAHQATDNGGMPGNREEELRILNRATRLLTEEQGLRDLLQMYRNALFQG